MAASHRPDCAPASARKACPKRQFRGSANRAVRFPKGGQVHVALCAPARQPAATRRQAAPVPTSTKSCRIQCVARPRPHNLPSSRRHRPGPPALPQRALTTIATMEPAAGAGPSRTRKYAARDAGEVETGGRGRSRNRSSPSRRWTGPLPAPEAGEPHLVAPLPADYARSAALRRAETLEDHSAEHISDTSKHGRIAGPQGAENRASSGPRRWPQRQTRCNRPGARPPSAACACAQGGPRSCGRRRRATCPSRPNPPPAPAAGRRGATRRPARHACQRGARNPTPAASRTREDHELRYRNGGASGRATAKPLAAGPSGGGGSLDRNCRSSVAAPVTPGRTALPPRPDSLAAQCPRSAAHPRE